MNDGAQDAGMSEHSPGPWVWQGLHRDGAPVLYACGGGEKRRLVKAATEPRLSKADAALMADGPAMLELLRRCEPFLGEDMRGETDALWNDVRSLLARHSRVAADSAGKGP